jgi:hypothetical protein
MQGHLEFEATDDVGIYVYFSRFLPAVATIVRREWPRQSRDHKSLEPRDAGRRQGRRGYLTIENRGSAPDRLLNRTFPRRQLLTPLQKWSV